MSDVGREDVLSMLGMIDDLHSKGFTPHVFVGFQLYVRVRVLNEGGGVSKNKKYRFEIFPSMMKVFPKRIKNRILDFSRDTSLQLLVSRAIFLHCEDLAVPQEFCLMGNGVLVEGSRKTFSVRVSSPKRPAPK
jgi:hypothetical protein